MPTNTISANCFDAVKSMLTPERRAKLFDLMDGHNNPPRFEDIFLPGHKTHLLRRQYR